ncbi:TetR/AcrR family transcriptional regulator [Pseudoduganella namucuonensis]|uniref:Transcriptional regulator, TetR family n=1 Tax=Pseudoduganella namucuonensis TaxID=1035707 RepID=A0A1I7LSL1_9BURK|nr:TetR/AcrR family transcriptional regulator [Pseudoduganella namucuonensis]SFV12632.1 transcriptional regulator, TetR family [Pseudoduganella namucuonensis]
MAREINSVEGEATRALLMDTAERLFAVNGVNSTSIRSINDAAGQGAASVHYHFGSKGALLEAILMRRGGAMMAAITERADLLLARTAPPSVRELVTTLFEPHANLIRDDPVGGGYWEQIISQLSLSEDPLLNQLSAQVTHKLDALLERTCPGVEPGLRKQRWQIAVLTLINLLGIHGSRSSAATPDASPSGFMADVEEFVIAGLEGAMRAARA